MHYDKDFGIDCRIARFHNIYGAGWGTGGAADRQALATWLAAVRVAHAQPGCSWSRPFRTPGRRLHCTRCNHARSPGAGPYGTWKGGREKAPAAFCRKALTAVGEVEMWGDGKQTRSFTFIDDCVEGILRITKSDFRQPLNLGSCEMVRDSCVCVCVCPATVQHSCACLGVL